MEEYEKIIYIACVLTLTTVGAACDWKTKRIPYSLTLPMFVGGLVFQTVHWTHVNDAGPLDGLYFALRGAATGFGIFLVVWLIGRSGTGDMKFMCALGTWLGDYRTFIVLGTGGLLVILAIGSLAVWEGICWVMGVAETKADKQAIESTRRKRIPLGVPIAIATWLLLTYIFHLRPTVLDGVEF